jgi:hypothetical protein
MVGIRPTEEKDPAADRRQLRECFLRGARIIGGCNWVAGCLPVEVILTRAAARFKNNGLAVGCPGVGIVGLSFESEAHCVVETLIRLIEIRYEDLGLREKSKGQNTASFARHAQLRQRVQCLGFETTLAEMSNLTRSSTLRARSRIEVMDPDIRAWGVRAGPAQKHERTVRQHRPGIDWR